MSFTVIPALDLLQGQVVLANADAGNGSRYRSLQKIYGGSDHPVEVLGSLLDRYGFASCYIADLDAIQGSKAQYQGIRQLRHEFPQLQFWLDCGNCNDLLPEDSNWQRVLGREAAGLLGEYMHAGYRDYVLSLDFSTLQQQDPDRLSLPDMDKLPQHIILMELAVIGTGHGPNINRLRGIQKAKNSKLYLSGGVRNHLDLLAAQSAGAHGAMCATALHNGSITPNQVRQLRQGQAGQA